MKLGSAIVSSKSGSKSNKNWNKESNKAVTGLVKDISIDMALNLGKTVDKLIESTAELKKNADIAGISIKNFQKLDYAASQYNISQSALTDGLRELNLRAEKFIENGNGSGKEAFQGLGYSASELKKKMKDIPGLIAEIAKKTENLSSSDKITILDGIFGGNGGKEFISILNGGSEAFKEMMKEAEKYGVIMDSSMIAKIVEANKSVDRLKKVLETKFTIAFAEAAPFLNQCADNTLTWVQNNEKLFKQNLPYLFKGIATSLSLVAESACAVISFTDSAAKGLAEFFYGPIDTSERLKENLFELKKQISNLTPYEGTNFKGADKKLPGLRARYDHLEKTIKALEKEKELEKQIESNFGKSGKLDSGVIPGEGGKGLTTRTSLVIQVLKEKCKALKLNSEQLEIHTELQKAGVAEDSKAGQKIKEQVISLQQLRTSKELQKKLEEDIKNIRVQTNQLKNPEETELHQRIMAYKEAAKGASVNKTEVEGLIKTLTEESQKYDGLLKKKEKDQKLDKLKASLEGELKNRKAEYLSLTTKEGSEIDTRITALKELKKQYGEQLPVLDELIGMLEKLKDARKGSDENNGSLTDSFLSFLKDDASHADSFKSLGKFLGSELGKAVETHLAEKIKKFGDLGSKFGSKLGSKINKKMGEKLGELGGKLGGAGGFLAGKALSSAMDFAYSKKVYKATVKAGNTTGTILGKTNELSHSLSESISILGAFKDENSTILNSIHGQLQSIYAGIDVISAGAFKQFGDFEGIASDKYSVFRNIMVEPFEPVFDLFKGFGKEFSSLIRLPFEFLGKAMGGIFGGGKTVKESGLYFGGGSVSNILENGIDAKAYAKIKKSGGWFSSSKTYYKYQELNEDLGKAVDDLFKNTALNLKTLAPEIGADVSKVLEYTFSVEKLDLKGLSAEKQQEKLKAFLSAQMDGAAEAVFGDLIDKYQKINEGLYQTAVRVVATKNIMTDFFEKTGAIGWTQDEIGAEKLISITQKLAQGFGGLDQAKSAMAGFYNNFAPDEEKNLNLENNLKEALRKVNVELPKTREGFWMLTQGLDIASEQGQEAYKTIVSVSGVADKYYKNLKKNSENFAQSIAAGKLNIDDALGKDVFDRKSFFTSIGLNPDSIPLGIAGGNEVELESSFAKLNSLLKNGKINTSQYNSILSKLIENYNKTKTAAESYSEKIKSELTDNLNKARDAYLDGLRNEISLKQEELEKYNQTAEAMENVIKSLDEYQNSLALDSLGQDKQLAYVKSEFLETAAKAKNGDLEAMEKLQSLSENYLSIAKKHGEGDEAYRSVQGVINETITRAEKEKKLGEDRAESIGNQIKQNEKIINELQGLKENQSLSQLRADYLKAKSESERGVPVVAERIVSGASASVSSGSDYITPTRNTQGDGNRARSQGEFAEIKELLRNIMYTGGSQNKNLMKIDRKLEESQVGARPFYAECG